MQSIGSQLMRENLKRSHNRVVVAAGLIRAPSGHPHAGKILMTKRLADAHLAHSWEFPGGKIEFGEDPIAALHREIEEELGISICKATIYAVGQHLYVGTKAEDISKDVILLVYDCELNDGEPQRLGVSDFSWLTPEEVCLLPLPPADVEVINRLSKECPHA
jgi:8-oxo-dGTP diphosphatase